MRTSVLPALAAVLATARSTYIGFNYGSTYNDGSAVTEAGFEALFTTAKNLVSFSDRVTSARLYTMIQAGTANEITQAIPAAINTGTSLLLGLWASAGDADFAVELAALKAAIDTYGSAFTDLVAGISIGSEDLYRNSPIGILNKSGIGAQPDTLASYIQQVKAALVGTVGSSLTVGHVDTWTAWVNASNDAVIEACDWLGMDAYPYFQTTMDNSIETSNNTFFEAYDNTVGSSMGKPVWITETGWPVSGPTLNLAVPSIPNAKTYWDEVGCAVFGKINTWWYTLQDAYPIAPTDAGPSFGIVGTTLSDTPLYDLTCPASSSSSASSSTSTASIPSTSATPVTFSATSASLISTDTSIVGTGSRTSVVLSSTTAVSESITTSSVTTPIPSESATSFTTPVSSESASSVITPTLSESITGSVPVYTSSPATTSAPAYTSTLASTIATTLTTLETLTETITSCSEGCTETPTPVTITTEETFTTTLSVPTETETVSASETESAVPTPSATGACTTDILSGTYEYPHLIVPVNSAEPSTAYGTSYFAIINSTVSSIFDFDIPGSDEGKTCTLVFLFPTQSELQTSSYSISGEGGIHIQELSAPATVDTTYDTIPAPEGVDVTLSSVTPGNSYVIANHECGAGQRVAFELSATGSLDLEYFEDYNSSPIGLFVSVC